MTTRYDAMTDDEIERAIDRAIEQTADAMKYSGPAGARMYRDELLNLATVRAARRTRFSVSVNRMTLHGRPAMTNAIGGPQTGRGVR